MKVRVLLGFKILAAAGVTCSRSMIERNYAGMQLTAVKENRSISQPRSSGVGWPHCLTLFVVIAAGTLVRFRCLACKPFWFDECFSVELARIDWRNFLHLMWWREANMSFYYMLLRVWLHLGQSPFFIRSLSAIISAATLPAIYWVAKLLYDRRAALIATALLALNAYSVRYSQEARSYALFLLLATISSGFLISWTRKSQLDLRSQSATSTDQARRIWGYVLVNVLAAYAHFYALLLLVAHWIALRLASSGRGEDAASAQWRGTWRTIGLAVLPLLAFVGKTGAGPIRWIQRPGLRDVAEFFKYLSGGNNWILPLIVAISCIAALAPFGRTLWLRHASWEVWRCQFLLLWLLFPILLTIVLSFARPVFLPRYMIFCLPALLILAAAGLARLNRWVLPPVMAAILLVSLQGTAFVYNHDLDTERDASGQATKFILDHTEPADAILFHIAEARVPYEFFRSLRARTNTASSQFTAELGPEILFPRHGPGLDYRDFTGKPTPEFVRSALQGHRRVWLMLMNNGTAEKPDPTTVMLLQILPQSFPNAQRWLFPRVEVRMYSKELSAGQK